ncbi:MAG: hypothetical protein QN174_06085 [Armatimonadota bacterium]|nr:hypothetical protein [Armatimonadota bacterium]MDR7421566.1 hypothetical protein [Armatimonadota bacterium]MDR7496509.1 hypothetical protein [Armatimonadota bacterium]MDR7512969.1 hypothetical protein [Armatimonadota bacterium]
MIAAFTSSADVHRSRGNLFDLTMKYADVLPLARVLRALGPRRGGA